MTGRARIAAVRAFAVATIGTGLCGPVAAIDPAASPIVRAGRACFSNVVRVAGYAAAREDAFVLPPVEGLRVTEILVQEGDTVTADQELIRLAPPGAPESTGPSPRPTGPSVRSPSAGIVARIATRIGAVTRIEDEPLMRLSAGPDLDLIVDVPSLYVTRIRAGSAARLLLTGGRELETTIRVASSLVDQTTQFGRARIAVPAASGLRAGLFARAVIETDRSCGPGLPRDALLRQNNETVVLVVRDGRVETRRVQVGLSNPATVEIRSGLAEGENVLANASGAF